MRPASTWPGFSTEVSKITCIESGIELWRETVVMASGQYSVPQHTLHVALSHCPQNARSALKWILGSVQASYKQPPYANWSTFELRVNLQLIVLVE